MPKEFLMRGKTNSGQIETLEFGHQARPGYGYRITEFKLWPSTSIGGNNISQVGSISAGTSAISPVDVSFSDDALIAVSTFQHDTSGDVSIDSYSIVNDLFVITQDLHLMVQDTDGGDPVNWQCRFEEVKLSQAAESVANFKQYTIYNTSQ